VLELGAGSGEEVAVAGGIDDHLGEDRLPAGLALEDRPGHVVALRDGVHAPAVQEHLDLGFFDHFDHQVLDGLGVHGGVDPRAAVDDRAVHLVEAAHHLLADALADLLAGLEDVPDDHEHEAAGPEAAEVAVALDEGHVRAGPPGGNGGAHARRSAPDHQHVGAVQDRQLAPGLDDLAVDEGRAASLGLDLALGDDVTLEPAGLGNDRLRGLRSIEGPQSGGHSGRPEHAQPITTIHRIMHQIAPRSTQSQPLG